MRMRFTYLWIAFVTLCTAQCRKSFESPAIKASNHFLAIDGIINVGVASSSTFNITRSLNLLDSVPSIPELNAEVQIQSEIGISYPLTDTGSNGVYVSAPLSLDPTQKYQLSVKTNDGNKYISELITPKISPPIDSLNWEVVNDPVQGKQVVNIYVNTHDETNSTRFYRWEYIETYQHESIFETAWGLKNGTLYPVEPVESTHNCWTTGRSTNILLGTSITLGSDIIKQIKIASFIQNDSKMDIKYSLLVKQYPLDLPSYNYWLTVQKNSQSLGGLFDLQPSQITGNFHSITNPGDPVLGLITASTIEEKRMFINHLDLPGWHSIPSAYCPLVYVPADPISTLEYNYPDTTYQLYYFTSGPTMILTKKPCLDCRRQGGTNIKPDFWQ